MHRFLIALALLAHAAHCNVIGREPLPCYFAEGVHQPFESFVVRDVFQYWCDGRMGISKALGCIVDEGFVLINTTAYVGKEVIRCDGTDNSIAVQRSKA